MGRIRLMAVVWLAMVPGFAWSQADERNPLFAYLTATPAPRLITYTPSELDPRQPANQGRLKTSSIRADLEMLRPVFEGLVLYGYHEACTPRILAVARDLKFKAVLLAVWDVKSAVEVDGVADLVRQHQNKDLVLGVILGNEGITFGRYETADLTIALERFRSKVGPEIPVATGEPLVGYKSDFILKFGDFLAPNIHPVFDRPKLAAAAAAAWAREEALELARRSGRPVLLKETGFPNGGKAPYDPKAQRAFWEAYLKPGLLARPKATRDAWVFHGVAFDAFDLPWKTQASGLAIEAHWGLFGTKRDAFPALEAWK